MPSTPNSTQSPRRKQDRSARRSKKQRPHLTAQPGDDCGTEELGIVPAMSNERRWGFRQHLHQVFTHEQQLVVAASFHTKKAVYEIDQHGCDILHSLLGRSNS